MKTLSDEKTRILTEILTQHDRTPERLREIETRGVPLTVVRLERPSVFPVQETGAIDVAVVVAVVKDGEETDCVRIVVPGVLNERHLDPEELNRTTRFLTAWIEHWQGFYGIALEPLEDARRFSVLPSALLEDLWLMSYEQFALQIDREHRRLDTRLKPLERDLPPGPA